MSLTPETIITTTLDLLNRRPRYSDGQKEGPFTEKDLRRLNPIFFTKSYRPYRDLCLYFLKEHGSEAGQKESAAFTPHPSGLDEASRAARQIKTDLNYRNIYIRLCGDLGVEPLLLSPDTAPKPERTTRDMFGSATGEAPNLPPTDAVDHTEINAPAAQDAELSMQEPTDFIDGKMKNSMPMEQGDAPVASSPQKTFYFIADIKFAVITTWNEKNNTHLLNEDIDCESRAQKFARPRQLSMYASIVLAKQNSLQEVGRRHGNRDHTTVLHAAKKISGLLTDAEPDQAIVYFLQAVSQQLGCSEEMEAKLLAGYNVKPRRKIKALQGSSIHLHP